MSLNAGTRINLFQSNWFALHLVKRNTGWELEAVLKGVIIRRELSRARAAKMAAALATVILDMDQEAYTADPFISPEQYAELSTDDEMPF